MTSFTIGIGETVGSCLLGLLFVQLLGGPAAAAAAAAAAQRKVGFCNSKDFVINQHCEELEEVILRAV